MIERAVSPELSIDDRSDERVWDRTLRPRRFDEFVGQCRIVDNLNLFARAASNRNEVLDHILLSGLPGLGKTTLAHLIAEKMGAPFRATAGPILERPGDLAGVLTHLEEGDVLFIDEIHRLHPVVEEYLYAAMDEFRIDIVIDQGPYARSMKVDLQPFTLIGATTREGLLSAPFRSRFQIREKLRPYPEEELRDIITRSSQLLGLEALPEAAIRLAECARGTPRIANRLLRRVRDLASVEGVNVISLDIANAGLEMLGIDAWGLDALDRQILKTIVDHDGGPVGLKTLACACGETERTIEETYEPFLVRSGMIRRTPRGRCVSRKAFEVLGMPVPNPTSDKGLETEQPTLFEGMAP